MGFTGSGAAEFTRRRGWPPPSSLGEASAAALGVDGVDGADAVDEDDAEEARFDEDPALGMAWARGRLPRATCRRNSSATFSASASAWKRKRG